MPANELDSLLLLLNERKQKLEREEAESNIEILLDFLHHSQSQKQEKLQEVYPTLFSTWSLFCLKQASPGSFICSRFVVVQSRGFF